MAERTYFYFSDIDTEKMPCTTKRCIRKNTIYDQIKKIMKNKILKLCVIILQSEVKTWLGTLNFILFANNRCDLFSTIFEQLGCKLIPRTDQYSEIN